MSSSLAYNMQNPFPLYFKRNLSTFSLWHLHSCLQILKANSKGFLALSIGTVSTQMYINKLEEPNLHIYIYVHECVSIHILNKPFTYLLLLFYCKNGCSTLSRPKILLLEKKITEECFILLAHALAHLRS